MFWKRKNKCPVTQEDKEWIEEKLNWIDQNVLSVVDQPTILPTKRFFNRDFQGAEEDAHFTLQAVASYMGIDTTPIILKVYSEEGLELDRGLVTQTDKTGSSGLFVSNHEGVCIWIEEGQLKKPNSLIATMAHELSHYVLFEEIGFELEGDENEWMTDLLAIAFGFGIFLGNTKFTFNQWQSGDGWGGWSTSMQGYLPHQIIAYAMAEIQNRKEQLRPDWLGYLKGDFNTDFMASIKFLELEN